MSIIKANQLIIGVYWDNYMKHINILWGKTQKFCVSQQVVRLFTTGLGKSNNRRLSLLGLFYAMVGNLCS